MLPAMVLCAGFGTRLRPLTDRLPKPLLPVGDRPAVLHILGALQACNLSPRVMNTHHKAEAFAGKLPPDVLVSHEERILGTAGGVRRAEALLGPGEVLVWNGDVRAAPDLDGLIAAHRASAGCLATLLAAPRPAGQGTLGVGRLGEVVRLRGELFGEERSGADFLGIQVLSPAARRRLPEEGCLVGDLYLPALRKGEHLPVRLHDGGWDDIGTPQALLQANLGWLQRMGLGFWSAADVPSGIILGQSVVCEGATLTGQGLVEQCLVLPGAQLQAPARGVIAMPGDGVLRVTLGS
jgi:mannose-1-phosphate guanylyltransferase